MSSSGPTKVPRFSVVTPSFNQAGFIAETMRSVLSQEGDFEIEYFVMDGGSTDGAVETIRRYAEEVATGRWDSRCAGLTMTWVSQKDGGQSDAINQGLRRASGDIVSYLNSDDAYLPGAFMSVARAFAADPRADFVFGDGEVIGEDGEPLWEWISRPYNQKVMTSYNFLWNDFTNYIMQQATFWRRCVHDRIGYFDEALHFVMDAEYWIRAGRAGLRLVHLPRKLARFCLIEGTKSKSSPTVFWEDYLEIFRRYRGAAALSRFFGYYYYNLAKHRDFDLDRALDAGRAAFAQWAALPLAERKVLEEQGRVGFGLACALVARTLLESGRQTDADLALRRGFRQCRGLLSYAAVASYLMNRAIPSAARQHMRWIEQFFVRQLLRRRSPARYVTGSTRSDMTNGEGSVMQRGQPRTTHPKARGSV